MKAQIGSNANFRSAAPQLVSSGNRAVVAVAVVCASLAAVWLADVVSSSLPPEMAQSRVQPEPRLASALPTVTVVGRRASLEPTPDGVLPASAPELSSLAAADLPSGGVKFRQ